MVWYHLSEESRGGEFSPRVPSLRLTGEDAVTPRICVAASIRGALRAIPLRGARAATLRVLLTEEGNNLLDSVGPR